MSLSQTHAPPDEVRGHVGSVSHHATLPGITCHSTTSTPQSRFGLVCFSPLEKPMALKLRLSGIQKDWDKSDGFLSGNWVPGLFLHSIPLLPSQIPCLYESTHWALPNLPQTPQMFLG